MDATIKLFCNLFSSVRPPTKQQLGLWKAAPRRSPPKLTTLEAEASRGQLFHRRPTLTTLFFPLTQSTVSTKFDSFIVYERCVPPPPRRDRDTEL